MITKTDTEQERAEFEAWAKTHYYLSELGLEFKNDEYVDMEVQGAFEAYQAGRAALQSQDRDSAIQAAINKLSAMTPRPPKAITYDHGWEIIDVVQRELCPAIDHARRVEGEEK